MKIGLCFLMCWPHQQPAVWNRYFELADPKHFRRYLHSANSAALVPESTRVPAVYTHWGKTMPGMTALWRASVDAGDDYAVLCSETCIPISTPPALLQRAQALDGASLIGDAGSNPGWGEFQWKGHQWTLLSRQHMQLLLEEYPPYYNRRFGRADDEIFPRSMLELRGQKYEVGNITYVNWNGDDSRHPRAYSAVERMGWRKGKRVHASYELKAEDIADIKKARGEGTLFARKFLADCNLVPLLREVEPALCGGW